MGNLASQDITISVHHPSQTLFNFHQDTLTPARAQPLDYPSFLKQSPEGIDYSVRSSFQDREYEISHTREEQQDCLVFNKIKNKLQPIWKVIGESEYLPLFEGCVIKMADTIFEIKKICRNFSQFEDYQESLVTMTDADPNYSLNNDLSNSRSIMEKMVSSRRLQNSRMLKYSRIDKSFQKGDSKASFGLDCEGQFCRYCYGRDSTTPNPLLSLCRCSGSMKYCHYLCLKNWISSRSVTRASDCYEYFEYDLSCEVCKQQMAKKTTHKGRKYVLYSESLIHPPFVVLSYRTDSRKVKEYIINFDYSKSIRLGRSSRCDITLPERHISQQHCELILEKGEILLKSLNPCYGTMVQIDDEWSFSPVDNQLQVMVDNSLVTIKDQNTSCLMPRQLKLRITANN